MEWNGISVFFSHLQIKSITVRIAHIMVYCGSGKEFNVWINPPICVMMQYCLFFIDKIRSLVAVAIAMVV